jgi:hypothetical protein
MRDKAPISTVKASALPQAKPPAHQHIRYKPPAAVPSTIHVDEVPVAAIGDGSTPAFVNLEMTDCVPHVSNKKSRSSDRV